MEKIIVNKILIDSHKIRITYWASRGIEQFFDNKQRLFWLDYSEDISIVPQSVAIIPFVCNVLPIIWLTNSSLCIPELDRTFFESIDEFKKGYIEMYPMLAFKGQLEVGCLVDNSYIADGGNAAFFSGGADAFTTLIAHREEYPILMTLRGADVKLDDIEGWNNVYNHLQKTVEQFQLSMPVVITSNFRSFIDEGKLSQLVTSSGDGWWHGFQHGIGLLGHAAPIAYKRHLEWIYIASSSTPQDIVTCASHYTIDNYVKFSSTKILHDQLELNRQDKIHVITSFCNSTGQHVDLRVCWISRGGKNCCHCEKCIRTMFALFAEGESPRDYGFDYTEEDLCNSKRIVIDSLYETNGVVRSNWEYVKERFIETGAYKKDKRINWVYKLDPYAKRHRPSFLKRVKGKLYRILH